MELATRWFSVAAVLLGLPVFGGEAGLIVCGADEVYVIPHREGVTKKDATWSWRAVNSPTIPAEVKGSFATTDECKSYGDNILISF